jgi:hypothetical protein
VVYCYTKDTGAHSSYGIEEVFMPAIIVTDEELEVIKAAMSYARGHLEVIAEEADLEVTPKLAESAEKKLYDNPDEIAIVWHVDDVRMVAPRLSKKKAREILKIIHHKHNAELGINWDVIRAAIEGHEL